MARHTRKGKSPGPVDSWLDKLGFYRKTIAYDETCLFRAVSEQMFSCQIYHERVRKECVTYARENYGEFRHLMRDEAAWTQHLNKLEIHMAICGDIEIKIVSKKYQKDVIVFDSMHRVMKNMTNNNYPDNLMLCLMGEDHYDVVYKQEHIQAAGFCQSIVYNILYENVFGIPKVSDIVQAMLYEKPSLTLESNGKKNQRKSSEDIFNELEWDFHEPVNKTFSDVSAYEQMVRTDVAPFPFKVAKALDPTIYRNIEYDTWTEIRRDLRLGEWYYGDNNFILGTCCQLRTENGTLQCYIQSILKSENKCEVYITSLAEKRIVDYTDLKPEHNAKAWPIPYRFSKNAGMPPPKLQPNPVQQNYRKCNNRRFRDNKRSTSKSSSESSHSATSSLAIELASASVDAYKGYPLQMQHSDDYVCEEFIPNNDDDSQLSYHDSRVQSDELWEQTSPTTSSASVVWQQSPQPMHNIVTYMPKAMMPTPPPMNYPDPPMFYNYQVWTNPSDVMSQQDSSGGQSPRMEVPTSPESQAFPYFPENMFTSPPPMTPMDRSMCTTPLTPLSPQIEMYQPFFSVPPPAITPIIYGSPEMMVPRSPHIPMYSPTIDMSFLSPPPFIYPPTPPAAWYPAPLNSQGFIFPPHLNTQNGPNMI